MALLLCFGVITGAQIAAAKPSGTPRTHGKQATVKGTRSTQSHTKAAQNRANAERLAFRVRTLATRTAAVKIFGLRLQPSGRHGHRTPPTTTTPTTTTPTSTTPTSTTPTSTTPTSTTPSGGGSGSGGGGTTTTPVTTTPVTTTPVTTTPVTTTPVTTTPAPPPPAQQGGGGLWSASSFLNTPISGFSLSSNSASWLNTLNGSETYGLWVDNQTWTPPLYHANSGTGTASVAIGNTGKHITIPYNSSFKPDPSGDSQLAIIDDSTGCEYEFQGFDAGSLSAHAEGTFHSTTGSGLHANDAGVTGSNISELGGLITVKDVNSGVINHALRYATPIGASSFVAPASRSDGSTGGGIPAGELMRLDPSLNLNGLGLTPFQLMIAKALQTYGAYNADSSGSFKLYAESTIDGASYNTAVNGLPWSVASHLQFGSANLGSTATNSNTEAGCNQQH